MSETDLVFILRGTPEPVIRYVEGRLRSIDLDVIRLPDEEATFLLHAPTRVLEHQAEEARVEMPLRPDAERAWSETDHPVRVFTISDRASFGQIEWSPALRATLLHEYLEVKLKADDAWLAALVASGLSEAAARPKAHWLIGPNRGWLQPEQPLLLALYQLQFLHGLWPAHTAGRYESLGVPISAARRIDWLAYLRRLARRPWQLVDADALRAYWGEKVAFYFAWQLFYLRALSVPAVFGLGVWARRPSEMSIDDDPYALLFSLVAIVWAIWFVHAWRREQAELAFRWGTYGAAAPPRLRPHFTGDEVTDPVSGRKRLSEPMWRRALRYVQSALVTAMCLTVPVAVMFASLNLQGYIQPHANRFLGCTIYWPSLSRLATPGALFDPSGSLSLMPVAMHVISINLLNKLYRAVATLLTFHENHRTHASFETSLVVKRWFFESFDCYLALFYIAFELQDVPRLRHELKMLFTVDMARRIGTETLIPLVLNWSAWRARHPTGGFPSDEPAAHAPPPAPPPASPPAPSPAKTLEPILFGSRPTESATTEATTEATTKATTEAPTGEQVARRTARQEWLVARTEAIRAEATLDEYNHFDDFLEMTQQFGYVTLFAAAFPLAAALSLVCNALEVLADGFKLVALSRRPRPTRAATIGWWGPCLGVTMVASIYTNLYLIAVASDQLAAVMPALFDTAGHAQPNAFTPSDDDHHEVKAGMGRYIVLYCVGVEHAMLLLLLLSERTLARPPAWVRLVLARRERERSRGSATGEVSAAE